MAKQSARYDPHEWLGLLEVDGPFISRPALDDMYDKAWPPRISNAQRAILTPPAEGVSNEWDAAAMARVDRLLIEVLGYEKRVTLRYDPGTAKHPIYDKAEVRPYAAVCSKRHPERVRMVVLAGPAAAETPAALHPTKTTTYCGWPSTVVKRAALAARKFGAELALVTNGYHHLIVWVGSGLTGYAWLDPSLYRLDRRLADAFVALFSASSVTSDGDTSTADLLRSSQERQGYVTKELGTQIRLASEALVNAVSRANRTTDGRLLDGVVPKEVYAGVVTVLMRTVFLLNAEDRDLMPRDELWDREYSVSGLLDRLDDDYYRHQGVMSRRHGAWLRLLAAARAVHRGVQHHHMNVPAYGGALFDPQRYPFLEGIGVKGEVFDVGVVDDATTRQVLDLLQRLKGERLSYRTLTVEQIGHVYESLLDHSAVRVPDGEVVLGLCGKLGIEPEVSLAELEQHDEAGQLASWLAEKHDPASGKDKEAKWQALLDGKPKPRVSATLARACHGEVDVLARVERFAGILRADSRGMALVFFAGDVYVTETAQRRDSGAAYTSADFAADIAQHALEHLVYQPGPHNEADPSKWQIKQPAEILALRVCDPAVGSGAILVAAVRYLADRLVEARRHYGELSDRDLATAADDPETTDVHVQACRDVVAQCVYAVDQDPMAVEMAKLSLWLITMAQGRPFTFLDHAIKCGDSLVGVTSLDQLRRLHLAEAATTQVGLDLARGRAEGLGGYFTMIDERIAAALDLREEVRDGDVSDVVDAQKRAELNDEADRLLEDLRLVADAITAVCFDNAGEKKKAVTDEALSGQVLPLAADIEGRRSELIAAGRPRLATDGNSFFHWALEFPEIMARRGGVRVRCHSR